MGIVPRWRIVFGTVYAVRILVFPGQYFSAQRGRRVIQHTDCSRSSPSAWMGLRRPSELALFHLLDYAPATS